jgi:hypothetical protein
MLQQKNLEQDLHIMAYVTSMNGAKEQLDEVCE